MTISSHMITKALIPEYTQRGEVRIMLAEFPSTCAWCLLDVIEGTKIIRANHYGMVHWRCYRDIRDRSLA